MLFRVIDGEISGLVWLWQYDLTKSEMWLFVAPAARLCLIRTFEFVYHCKLQCASELFNFKTSKLCICQYFPHVLVIMPWLTLTFYCCSIKKPHICLLSFLWFCRKAILAAVQLCLHCVISSYVCWICNAIALWIFFVNVERLSSIGCFLAVQQVYTITHGCTPYTIIS